MNIPEWAGFVADFPDDQVETREQIVLYGGRHIAVALGEILGRLGCSRISAPNYGQETGWDFRFQYSEGHPFWCRVQSFHPIYWLLLERPSGRRGTAAHLELWQKLSEALEQDPRFDQIRWRSSKEGPPDWDEFTVTSDLPPPAPLVELPSRSAKAPARAEGKSLASTTTGLGCVLFVTAIIAIDAKIHDTKQQGALTSLAVAGLLLMLAIALPVIEMREKRRLESLAGDQDSDV